MSKELYETYTYWAPYKTSSAWTNTKKSVHTITIPLHQFNFNFFSFSFSPFVSNNLLTQCLWVFKERSSKGLDGIRPIHGERKTWVMSLFYLDFHDENLGNRSSIAWLMRWTEREKMYFHLTIMPIYLIRKLYCKNFCDWTKFSLKILVFTQICPFLGVANPLKRGCNFPHKFITFPA